MKQNFETLNVWIKARELSLVCYELTKKFPREELYGLSDQIRRAAISIPSNIAEGYSRKSIKDLFHFLDISTGSIYEIMTQIDIAMALNIITKNDKSVVFEKADEVLKLINGFKKYKRGDNDK